MSTLGVLAQLEKEREEELLARANQGLLQSSDEEPSQVKLKKYKLAMRKKGAGSILKEALLEGAGPEELELLRQLKFVRE